MTPDIAEQLPSLIAERAAELGVLPSAEAITLELAKVFDVTRRTEEMSKSIIKVYIEDLREYPLSVLQAACIAWRRREVFFPAIAEIRSECEGLLDQRRKELWRLRVVQAIAENPPEEKYRSDEWTRKIQRIVARAA